MNHPASYSPLLLQAQITAQPGGEMGLADTTRLENPFQGPMWLDEIRFRLPSSTGLFAGGYWSGIWCKLRLGDLPITQGNVPIALLGKELNGSLQGAIAPYIFTWKLPKPLFIPARELLRPTIYFSPFVGAAASTVTIAYACRPLAVGTPTPRKLNVPWVAAYVPPFQATGVAAADRIDLSQPSDLYNPWRQDLHVQRFVGRLLFQTSSPTGAVGEPSYIPLSAVTPNLEAGLPTSAMGTLVSAQDSFNNILIRDPTPFSHIFDFLDRSWTVNAVLPSMGFYQFQVERFWSQYATTAVTASPAISMVGWREVDYLGS